MPKRKVSIEDVAARANVSITTVSRVINNVPTVSNKNRSKVEEAIAHLKFRPNISAQRLASGVNKAIGLVIPGYPGIFHSFYAIELIRGVGHACEALRLDLVFQISDGSRHLNSGSVGGYIFADVIENRKQIEAAVAVGTPAFVINNKADDLDVSYIAINNSAGGKLAADYLYSLGHRNIATVTGNLNTQAAADRLEGFKKFLKSKKVSLTEKYIFKGDYSRRCARQAAEQFLSMERRPTAVFAASDEMALELIAVMLENGVKVPEDISVIGFDDNPACLYGPVAVTTIKQPLFKMAEEAVRHLNNLNSGKTLKKITKVLSPELIVRESCGAVNQ